MNKPEFIKAVAKASGTPITTTEKIVNELLEVAMDTLAKGDEVRLIGFGTLKPAKRKAREIVNPSTGEPMMTQDRTVAKFQMGSRFKARLNDED